MAPPPCASTSRMFDARRDDIIDLAEGIILLTACFVYIYVIVYILILGWLIEREGTKKEYFRLRDVELGRLPAGELIQEQSDGEESGLANDHGGG